MDQQPGKTAVGAHLSALRHLIAILNNDQNVASPQLNDSAAPVVPVELEGRQTSEMASCMNHQPGFVPSKGLDEPMSEVKVSEFGKHELSPTNSMIDDDWSAFLSPFDDACEFPTTDDLLAIPNEELVPKVLPLHDFLEKGDFNGIDDVVNYSIELGKDPMFGACPKSEA